MPLPATSNSQLATSNWLPLTAAAQRLGRSEGHLRRLCLGRWLAEGLAAQRPGPAGGKPAWWIHESADPALARIKGPDQLSSEFDLSRLSARHRQQLLARERVLQAWESAVAGARAMGRTELEATTAFIAHQEAVEGLVLSRRSLMRWRAEYRARGRAGLVDERRISDGGGKMGDPFHELLQRLYLTKRRRSKQVCYEMAAEEGSRNGWAVPSLRTAKRFLERLPIDLVTRLRFGEDAYTDECEPYIERDYTTIAANAIWCADHHQMDVIVNAGTADQPKLVRPWLTAWMDLRSRRIVGWRIFVHDPNSDVILLAFRDAVLALGVPGRVLIDNGKDYDCYALMGMTKQQRRRRLKVILDARAEGVFALLGVEVTHAWKFHGQSKPIERWFGTVEDRFCRGVDTYFGNCPQNRPDDLDEQLAAGRAPMLADFIAAFAAWLEIDYHQRPHAGDGMDGRSPLAVYAECLQSVRTTRPELLNLAMRIVPGKPSVVHQNGVTWQGIHYGQYEPALRTHLKQKVRLRVDPADISQVTVWTLDDKFLCVATANRKLPADATSQELRAAIREKRQDRKRIREASPAIQRIGMSETDRIIAARAEQNRLREGEARAREGEAPAEPRLLPPPSIKPVRTRLDDQLPALQRAVERRKMRPVVTSESIDILAAADAEMDFPEARPSSGFDLLAAALSEES